jgi:hypothetical protein
MSGKHRHRGRNVGRLQAQWDWNPVDREASQTEDACHYRLSIEDETDFQERTLIIEIL